MGQPIEVCPFCGEECRNYTGAIDHYFRMHDPEALAKRVWHCWCRRIVRTHGVNFFLYGVGEHIKESGVSFFGHMLQCGLEGKPLTLPDN